MFGKAKIKEDSPVGYYIYKENGKWNMDKIEHGEKTAGTEPLDSFNEAIETAKSLGSG